jgi:uncharacterized protein (DUF2126 family)
MYHRKIELPSAALLQGDEQIAQDPAARLWAALIICGLPLIGAYLLVQFLWSDVKAVARGLRFFYSALSEELIRKP